MSSVHSLVENTADIMSMNTNNEADAQHVRYTCNYAMKKMLSDILKLKHYKPQICVYQPMTHQSLTWLGHVIC